MIDSIKRYGSTTDENRADAIQECRQIVRTVITYGVDQFQLVKLIELFALELENRDHMQQISTLLGRLEKNDSTKSTLITEVQSS